HFTGAFHTISPSSTVSLFFSYSLVHHRVLHSFPTRRSSDLHPVQGVIEEVAAIVGRYMPNFPVPEQMPTEPDQNKETIPENEEEELEDIQDDQSNHHTDQ